jgi:(E)-4-hydroxy-3-methyl-but-2-enyl pyrophosphate reductase
LKVRLAATAGFCMGVRRAMEITLAEANRGKGPIFTYGPLIHNSQVLDLLESKNVKAVDDITGIKNGTLIIRAHGIPPQKRKILKASGLRIIDATCPKVAQVQAIIRYHAKKGYTTIIVGDMDHAEVIGLIGYATGKAYVINSEAEVAGLPVTEKLLLVAQTTQNEKVFSDVIQAVKERCPDALVFNTICDATSERQKEVKILSSQVDGMVVVGGYHSGNTQRLAEISTNAGKPTFHVETEKELDKEKLSSMDVIGVTAGASTPNWMIRNVVKEIEAIRSHGETWPGRMFKKLLKFLLLSNFMVSLGAFCLSYAAGILSNRKADLIHPLLAFLYVYGMRVFNRFLDKGAGTYNDPERAGFYEKYRVFLILSGVGAILAAMLISFQMGPLIFIAVTALSLMGVIYSIPLVPLKVRHLWKYTKMRDIPGSKNLLEALAWAAVITLLPLLEPLHMQWLNVLFTFFFVLMIAFVRAAFFDILEVQGDLVVGVETLPITLGEKKTLLLLKIIVISATVMLIMAFLLKAVGLFALLMLLPLFILTFFLGSYEKGRIQHGPYLEYMVEGNFLVAGLLALMWQLLS